MEMQRPTPESFNEQLRNGLFFELWEQWHPPIRNVFTIESLPEFATALKKRADKHDFPVGEGFLMEELTVYAFYFGETLVRNVSGARWIYQELGAAHNKVEISEKNIVRLSVLPFNTSYKVARGFINDLPGYVEALVFTAKNGSSFADKTLDKQLTLPNGINMTLRQRKDLSGIMQTGYDFSS